jgi:hypothetical protein
LEHQMKMAAIESKYYARVSSRDGRSGSNNMDEPERMEGPRGSLALR